MGSSSVMCGPAFPKWLRAQAFTLSSALLCSQLDALKKCPVPPPQKHLLHSIDTVKELGLFLIGLPGLPLLDLSVCLDFIQLVL